MMFCKSGPRPLKSDRLPITPIARADLPFQVMNMDCIGPLDPPSAPGHKYCLCVVDSCTRWPAVYALKNLSAKAVCDALIDFRPVATFRHEEAVASSFLVV